MAKRKARTSSDRLNATAESIGTALGRVAAKIDRWKQERAEIAAEVQRILKSAQGMLGDLGGAAGRGATAFKSAVTSKGGRPKGYRTSEATKRKLRAAWKRRKAAMTSKGAAKDA
jgi:hypothetical protein